MAGCLGLHRGLDGACGRRGGGAAEAFPWTSLAAVDADPGADLIYSPLSLSLAFSMLYAGSAGDSAAQLREVFGFAPVAEEPARAGALIDALSRFGESKAIQLRIANSVWLQPNFPFEPAYTATVQADYRSESRLADFRAAPEPARATINMWVEDRTAGRIRDLLPAGSIDPLSRFVLVNALYFKAPWLHPFRPQLTRDAVFHVSANETADVRMMHQIVDVRLLETDFADYLELPFLDPDVSMILVLPRLTSADNTALLC